MKKLALTLLIFLPFFIHAQIIHIPDDFQSIQEGINAAVPGDTVLVAPGNYIENISWSAKDITLASHYLITQDTMDIVNTIIDGGGMGSVLSIEFITDASSICGFTIQNGSHEIGPGGGIWLEGSSPHIRHVNIVNNSAFEGGGLACFDGDIVLYEVNIKANIASESGGGIFMFNSRLDMQGCHIEGNDALNGGGMFLRFNFPEQMMFDIKMEDCAIVNNTAVNAGGGGYIRMSEGVAELQIYMHLCLFENNVAKANTGLFIRGENIEFRIYNTRFIHNSAIDYTAGFCAMSSAHGELINCLFAHNMANTGGNDWNGGGITLWGGAEVNIINCTFSENHAAYGAGIVVGPLSEARVYNCVFWANVPDQAVVIDFNDMGGVLHIDYTDIQDGIDSIRVDPLSQLDWGDHNISGDPLFIGSGDDEYALSDGSPCIDNGTPDTSMLNILFYDLINNYRLWDGDGNGSEIIDMGAYEFDAPIWVGLPSPPEKPDHGFISSIYPNPSMGKLNIKYNARANVACECNIFSCNGEYLRHLTSMSIPGENEITMDLGELPSGIYLVRMICGTESSTRKIIIRK